MGKGSLLMMALASAVAWSLADQGPVGDLVNVFSRGESGYFCVKIPTLMHLQSGRFLAFGEGRKVSCSDYAETELIMKHSDDGGKTWSPLRVLYGVPAVGMNTTVIGNAAPVQLRSGKVLVVFCRNNLEVFVTESGDDGLTWTSPRNITAGIVDPKWGWVGTGPPASLELSSGRIITPSYHSDLPHNKDGDLAHSHVFYSDDQGATWHLGGTLSSLEFYTNECQAVQLRNGSVLINARSFGFHRMQALSHDGGQSWGTVHEVTELAEPVTGCEMSTIRHNGTGWLFFSGPTHESIFREGITLWISKDEGASWEKQYVFFPGASGYSALVAQNNGDVACLFETAKRREVVMLPDHIAFQVVWSNSTAGGAA